MSDVLSFFYALLLIANLLMAAANVIGYAAARNSLRSGFALICYTYTATGALFSVYVCMLGVVVTKPNELELRGLLSILVSETSDPERWKFVGIASLLYLFVAANTTLSFFYMRTIVDALPTAHFRHLLRPAGVVGLILLNLFLGTCFTLGVHNLTAAVDGKTVVLSSPHSERVDNTIRGVLLWAGVTTLSLVGVGIDACSKFWHKLKRRKAERKLNLHGIVAIIFLVAIYLCCFFAPALYPLGEVLFGHELRPISTTLSFVMLGFFGLTQNIAILLVYDKIRRRLVYVICKTFKKIAHQEQQQQQHQMSRVSALVAWQQQQQHQKTFTSQEA